MKNCDILQKSLDWCEGQPNYAGIKRKVFYTAVSNIITWPTRKKTEAGKDLAAYDEKSKFTLKADKKFHYIEVLPAKCSSTSESQGDFPSSSQLNKLELVIPTASEENANAAAYINNVPCVFLVEDMEGSYRVFGCERWANEIKNTVSQDMGQGSAGAAETKINVEAPDTTPMPFYTGELDVEDEDAA